MAVAKWSGDGLAAGTLTTASIGPGDTGFDSLSGTRNIVASGVRSPRIQIGAGVANTYFGWSDVVLGTLTNYTVTAYIELPSIGTASWTILSGSTATSINWRVDIAGTGSSPAAAVRLRDTANQLAASTVGLATGTAYRVEVTVTNGAAVVNVYAGDTTTLVTTVSGTITGTTINYVRFGNFSSSTTAPAMFFDDLAVTANIPAVSRSVAASAASNVLAAGIATVIPQGAVPASAATNTAVLGAAVDQAPNLAPETAVVARTQALTVPFDGPIPVVRRSGYFVVIRDRVGKFLGAINPTNVRMTLRYNDVSDWSINVPLDRTNAALLRTPGAGVLIFRSDALDRDPILSGPIGTRTINSTEDGPHITVEGPDDMVWVSGRIGYQNPARTAANQNIPQAGAISHDRRTGPAETVIKGYVSANVGPSALAARRRLVIEADSGRGASVAGSARMTPLLPLIQGLATTGGVGFKVVQNATAGLEFRVFTSADVTAKAHFSPELRNVTEWSLFEKAPTTTVAIVGGQGQMLDRLFIEQEDATAYVPWPDWRMETFQNRTDTNLTAELNQTLAEMLLEGGPAVSLSITTRDTPRLKFGVDYRMGDKVTVEPIPGYVVQDVIREVDIDWTADEGESIVTRVGTSETTGTPAIQKLARKLKVKSEAVETVE